MEPSLGFPLKTAIIGAANIEASLKVYRDVMALQVVERRRWAGPEFEALFRLPPKASAEVAVLADRGFEHGRITLLQFDARERIEIRAPGNGVAVIGLLNLNFYARDIVASTESLRAAGCRPWSQPVPHDMGPEVGAPMEVMIDGPDTVVINLLQHGTDPECRTGRTGLYMRDEFGYSASGLSPVVTSAHNVRDMEQATAFYAKVLGLEPIIDVVMDSEAMTTFMALPAGSRTRTVIVQGPHRFGKIAIGQPLNYPTTDLVPRAEAPGIGYIAQCFAVVNLDGVVARALALGGVLYSGPLAADIPGVGRARTAMLRHPSSGALQQFVEG